MLGICSLDSSSSPVLGCLSSLYPVMTSPAKLLSLASIHAGSCTVRQHHRPFLALSRWMRPGMNYVAG